MSHVGNLSYIASEEIAYSAIDEPTKIENEREIILFSCVFKEGGFIQSQGHIADIVNNLSIYDYSYIVKCKFTK